MKKVIGVLLIIFGVVLIIAGVAVLVDINSRNNSIEGRLGATFSERYRDNADEQQQAGTASIVGGFVFLVIGIVLTASGGRRLDTKHQKVRYETPVTDEFKQIDILTDRAIKHYNSGEYSNGVLLLKRALQINPANNRTHYNLACLYSKLENKEAFDHLSKAVEFGYTNFQKIKTENVLSWLRSQPEYEGFVRNGLSLSKTLITDNDEKLIEKLERLGKLKQQGLLTEEEFQSQKAKIIS